MDHEVRIDGGWLGTYYYAPEDGEEPVRFEAQFASGSNGRFRGTIIDDGHMGDATAVGRQQGRRVEFVKTYNQKLVGFATAPINYEGAISEDGKTMNGVWRLKARGFGVASHVMTGTWDAHRMWNEAQEADTRPEEVVEALAVPALPY